MTKKQACSFSLLVVSLLTAACSTYPATQGESGNASPPSLSIDRSRTILVLGSADPDTRAARIDLTCQLIKRQQAQLQERRPPVPFDRVILSGGCGAHNTGADNCEATAMEGLMRATCPDLIPAVLAKEEKSQTTRQNLCYSLQLERNRERLLNREDIVYVVSSHYHALSVAACLKDAGADAHYYYMCGGKLYDEPAPALADVVSSTDSCYKDYSRIAAQCHSWRTWCGSR